MGYAVLFPGQGSQFVGMGADLFDRRLDLLGGEADEVLGWSLRQTCLEGPEEVLTRTEVAQPALFALSYVLWEAFRQAVPAPPQGAAGHSLGEYTAVAAAGSLSFLDALRLVSLRGKAMARASDAASSGMAALIGVEADQAEALAQRRRDEGGSLWVANLNAPGQIVMAGGEYDLGWLDEHAAEAGGRRVVPLRVAGAFHTPFMEPAAEELADALRGATFAELDFPVWSNTDAEPYAGDIGETLLRQMTRPVRFADSLTAMAAAGAEAFVHVGPSDVTAGLARRNAKGSTVLTVDHLESVSAAADELAPFIE